MSASLIISRLPVTLWLIVYTVVLTVLISVPLAMLAASRKDGIRDHLVRAVPVPGLGSGFTGHLRSMFLPALTVTVGLCPVVIRALRASMLEVLHRGLRHNAALQGGLRPAAARQILNLLSELRAALGLTLVLISHNLAVVRHLCDTVGVMYLGRIVEAGPADTLLRSPGHPYTKGLIAAIPRLPAAAAAADAGADGAGHGDGAVRAGLLDTPPALQGDPPSPMALPAGCRFRSRCPIAQPRCGTDDPALIPAPDDQAHQVACHYAFAPVPVHPAGP